MPDPTVILGELAEDFTAKVRNGHAPDIESYATQHPELADRIRELFPALMLLEGLAAAPTGATVDERTNDPTATLPAGTIFGQYRIDREIARGGMGIVYEAEHLTLHRQVALKILPMAGPQAAKQLERFLREAKTAAGLHHTNIVPVFDVGQVRGVPYYAMQYINGQSLDQSIKASRPLGGGGTSAHFRHVADVGTQAAGGLAHAHQRGVIHRDIKPSNLLLDDQGVVWITDFGLARRHNDVSLTHSGQIIGTPRYMSPEQAAAAAQPLGHRTDIYSLGATLYELLTRRPAFDGLTPQDVVKQIIAREPIRPRLLDPHVPRDLETVVLKAMAKRPEDRYPTAQALADDLQRFTNGEPIQARRIGIVGRTWRWAKREPVTAGLVGAVVVVLTTGVVTAAVLAIWATNESKQTKAAHNELLQYVQATSEDIAVSLNEPAEAEFKEFLWFIEALKHNPSEKEKRILSTRLANYMRYKWSEELEWMGKANCVLANHALYVDVGDQVKIKHHMPMEGKALPPLARALSKAGLSYPPIDDDTIAIYSEGDDGGYCRLWSTTKDRPLSPKLHRWLGFQRPKHHLGAFAGIAVFHLDGYLYCVEKEGIRKEPVSIADSGMTITSYTLSPLNVTQWQVSPQFDDEGDLLQISHLLAGRRLDKGRYTPLAEEEARSAWSGIQSKYPDVFTVPIDDLLAWHLRDDEASIKQKHRHAALFAANFDCRDRPNDPHPFVARGRLFTVLGEWDKAEADFAKAWQLGGTGWVKSECRRLGRDALNDAKDGGAKRQSLEVALRKAEIAGRYLLPIGPHCWARMLAHHRLGLPLDAADRATLSWLLCGMPMAG